MGAGVKRGEKGLPRSTKLNRSLVVRKIGRKLGGSCESRAVHKIRFAAGGQQNVRATARSLEF